jgi:Serine endopeptidase inhibitors
MKDRQQKGQAVPPPDAATSTPFFARFLEDQHGDAGAAVKAPGAHTNAGPTRMTLKYPSDRDEIEDYSST